MNSMPTLLLATVHISHNNVKLYDCLIHTLFFNRNSRENQWNLKNNSILKEEDKNIKTIITIITKIEHDQII